MALILEEMIKQLDFRQMNFINTLELALKKNSNSENAVLMANYVRNSKPEREFQYYVIEILTQELKGNYKKEDL